MVAVFSVTMIFFTQRLGAQNADSAVTSNTAGSQSVTQTMDESQIWQSFENTDVSGLNSKSKSASVGVGMYVRMIFVLAFILVLIYFLLKFFKKYVGFGDKVVAGDDTFLRRVASISVGQNKTVQIVTLVDRAYLVGVSDTNVNLISEIKDPELVNAMNLYADKNDRTARPKSFADVLDLFMPHGPRNATSKNVFDNSGNDNILDSMKSQQNRFEYDMGEEK